MALAGEGTRGEARNQPTWSWRKDIKTRKYIKYLKAVRAAPPGENPPVAHSGHGSRSTCEGEGVQCLEALQVQGRWVPQGGGDCPVVGWLRLASRAGFPVLCVTLLLGAAAADVVKQQYRTSTCVPVYTGAKYPIHSSPVLAQD